MLWRCWLGGRKGIRPVKNWALGCWHGYLSGARCRLAQLMPLPLTVSCFSKIQIGFTFLVPADLGSPGKRAVKRVCVCVCILVTVLLSHMLRATAALCLTPLSICAHSTQAVSMWMHECAWLWTEALSDLDRLICHRLPSLLFVADATLAW